MTRMRYVKMDRIMNHMLIHALREVFRQEKEQGLPVDTTRDLVLKLAEQEEGKLYLTEAEHSKSVEALNQLRDTYLKNGRYSDGIYSVLLKIMKSRYRPYRGRVVLEVYSFIPLFFIPSLFNKSIFHSKNSLW